MTADAVDHAVIALVTAPTDRGGDIAEAIVERRLAACVNVMPLVRSVYRWRGAVEHADESLLIVKTLRSRIEDVDTLLREIHPYETFELMAVEVAAGNEAYLRWIAEASAGPDLPA